MVTIDKGMIIDFQEQKKMCPDGFKVLRDMFVVQFLKD